MGRWQTLLASGVAVAALASAAPGDGATLVYRDGAGNLRGAAADGSRTVGYTADASPGGKQYIAPSVDDRGSVVVAAPVPDQDGRRTFQVLNNAGALWAGPYGIQLPQCSTTPFQSAIDPAGSTVAFAYYRAESPDDCGEPQQWTPQTTLIGLRDTTGVHVPGMYAPVWTRLPEPGVIGIIGYDIYFQAVVGGVPQGSPRLVVRNPSPIAIRFLGVDPHPADGRLMVEAEAITADGQSAEGSHDLVLFQSPADRWDLSPWLCSVELPDSTMPGAARPRYSPDGALMSWTAADGIRVAAAPTADPAYPEGSIRAACGLGADPVRLAIAGGRDAAWTPASLPSPAPPPPPAPAPQPPPAPPTVTATARPKAPGVTLRRAGKRVQMRLRLGAPALAGRAVDLQIRGKRWVRVARVARVPANGRINRRLLVPTHLLRGRASLRVRVVVRPSPVALGATGAVRAVGVPGPLRVPNLRRPK